MTILSRITGMVREMMVAYWLGTGPAADALALAIKFPTLFRRLFAEGALSTAFIPLFTKIWGKEGRDAALQLAGRILFWLAGSVGCLVLCVELFLPQLSVMLFGGLKHTPARLAYFISYATLTFPFILCMAMAALFTGMLQARHYFLAASSAPFMGNLFILIVAGLGCHFGAVPGKVFAMTILGAGVFQLLYSVVLCKKRGLFPYFVGGKRIHTKAFFQTLGPVSLSAGIMQFNVFVGGVIASWLPVGSISYLNFAERLHQLPVSVIGTTLATVLLPLLASHLSKGDIQKANAAQWRCFMGAMLLVFPVMGTLWVFAYPLADTLYTRGAFTSADALATALTLRAYLLGLPALVVAKIFTSHFFALREPRAPLIAAIFSVVTDIVLSLLWMQPYHHYGVAAATSAAGWVYMAVLGFFVWKKGAIASAPPWCVPFGLRCLGSLLGFAVCLFLSHLWWLPMAQSSCSIRFCSFVAAMLFPFCSYGVLVYYFAYPLMKSEQQEN